MKAETPVGLLKLKQTVLPTVNWLLARIEREQKEFFQSVDLSAESQSRPSKDLKRSDSQRRGAVTRQDRL